LGGGRCGQDLPVLEPGSSRRADSATTSKYDSRMVRKHYGRTFFDSLPPARRVVAPTGRVLESMRAFFGG
jgi:Rad3-related DNA helicase